MRLLAVVAVCVMFAAPASAQVQLRFKFKAGDVIRQKTTQEMKSAAEVQGQKINTSMNQVVNTEQAVESVDADGSARVRQKISRIRMSMKAPFGQGFDFDSSDESVGKAPPVVANMLKQLAGAEFQASVSPAGTFTDITIPPELEQALKGAPGSPFGGGGGGGGADSIQQMMGQSVTSFPEQPVSQGDSWSDDLSMKLQFGEMKIHRTSTYEGTNDQGLHVINITMQLELVPGENQQVRMTIKQSDAKGTLLFDNSQGQLVRSEVVQKMTMEASVMGQTFDTIVEQKATTERDSDSAE
ncbi:MAG: DUF6263 family protein [Planctomycetaceae bacterium]